MLVQYPEWFTAKKANREELSAIRRRWDDLPVCVEFRSPTWLAAPEDRDRTLHTLGDLDLALVVVDAPKASKLPVVVEVTKPDLAVIRFHGRNDETVEEAGNHCRGTLRLPLHQTATAYVGTQDRGVG